MPGTLFFIFSFIFIFTFTITREQNIEHCIRICTPNLQTSDPIPKFPNRIMKHFRHSHTHPAAEFLAVVDDYYEC